MTLDPGLGECPQTPLPGLAPKEDAKGLANQRRRQRDAPSGSTLGVLDPGFSGVLLLTVFCK